MIIDRNPTLGNLFSYIATEVDIPEHLAQKAIAQYEEIGNFLCAPDSPLLPVKPEVFPQGSFLLGTTVRPLGKTEYDIDCVCLLQVKKENTTQTRLKDMVGDRLKENPHYQKVLRSGRRCWTLDFPTNFHLDILPAIPDIDDSGGGILITDAELHFWQASNPRGYAEWFKQQMLSRFIAERELLAKALNEQVENVPDWKVKTPLQRTIQFLKLHRDTYFGNDEDKPISIIITTLAARAYSNLNTLDVYEALMKIVEGMPKFIEKRGGIIWIPNPVNDRENFADKWQGNPQRMTKFIQWLDKTRQDLERLATTQGIDDIARVLKNSIDENILAKAVTRFGKDLLTTREQGAMRMATKTGVLGTQGEKVVRQHTNHGDSEG